LSARSAHSYVEPGDGGFDRKWRIWHLALASGRSIALTGAEHRAPSPNYRECRGDRRYGLPRLRRQAQCTTRKEQRIKRWEHESVIDAMQQRLDRAPEAMRIRRLTVEHPFGTIWEQRTS